MSTYYDSINEIWSADDHTDLELSGIAAPGLPGSRKFKGIVTDASVLTIRIENQQTPAEWIIGEYTYTAATGAEGGLVLGSLTVSSPAWTGSFTAGQTCHISIVTDAAYFNDNTGDQTISLTGDVTGSGTGSFAATIANNAVSDAKLRDSAALSVIGRSANSSGDPADIAAANDGEVLRRSGTAVGFGTVAAAGIANDAVTDAKIRDSAALSVIGRSANSSGDPADIAAGSDGHVLRRSGTSIGFGTVATAGIANDAITDALIRNSAGLSVVGRSTNSTGDPADIVAANDGEVLRRNGTAVGFGTVATAGVADDAITYAKIQNVSATDKLLGRSTAGSGDVEEITCTATGRSILDDASAAAVRTTIGVSIRGYIDGLTLSNNGSDANNDIDIAVGAAASDDAAATDRVMMELSSSITKRLDAAWAVGTNQGGIDTGSEANSTWYYMYLIQRPDTGVVDVLFSTSATSPTMPTNYTKKRYIGAVFNNGSGNISAFKQTGDWFEYSGDAVTALSTATPSTSITTLAMPVPRIEGIVAVCMGYVQSVGTGVSALNIGSGNCADWTSASSPTTLAAVFTENPSVAGRRALAAFQAVVNSSAQIKYQSLVGTDTVIIWCRAWIDRRGRQ